MAVQMLGIKTKFTDDQGRPLIGGSVHTYYAGTSLPQDTFSDPELTVPNTNPVKLDDTGSANIFLKGTYRVRVFDKNGVFVEEQDNVDQLATVAEVFENKGGLNAANERIDALTSEVNSIKEKTIVVESIADLSTINNPKDGLRVYVKSYHAGLGKGGGYFVYDESKADINDNGLVINGWVRDLSSNALKPTMFGAKCDGETDDTQAIKHMLSTVVKGYRTFDFEGVVYYLGSFDASDREPIFEFREIHGLDIRAAKFKIDCNLELVAEGELVPEYSNTPKGVFSFIDCGDLDAYIGVESNGYDNYTSQTISAVLLISDSVSVENIKIDGYCKNAVSFVETKAEWKGRRTPEHPIMKNITINGSSDIATYGVRLVRGGENMLVNINTNYVKRSFYIQGIRNVTAVVNSRNQRELTDILIKSYVDDVKNINVTVNSYNQQDKAENILTIEHQNNDDDTRITNVNATINVINRGNPKSWGRAIAAVGRRYDRRTVELAAATDSVTDNVSLNINYDTNLRDPVLDIPSYQNKGGLVELNTIDYIRETNGMTLKQGNKYTVSTSKNPVNNPLSLTLKTNVAGGVIGKTTLLGIENFANSNFSGSFVRYFDAKMNLNSGDSLLNPVNLSPVTDIGDTAEEWGFITKTQRGKIITTSSKDITTGASKFAMVFEPIVATNFI